MTDEEAAITMLNAGIDMFMMNGSKATTERLIKNLKKALNHP